MKKKHHKNTFDNIPIEKKEKILRVAISELSKKGLSNARIKDIAEKAGISYGSMYNYFSTKDDLVRTVIQKGWEFQKKVFSEAKEESDNLFDRIETILHQAQKYSRENPELISIWREIGHGYNSRFVHISFELEKEGANFWKDLIKQGIESGDISKDIDVNSAAFCIDSIFSSMMKSYISDFQKNLLSMFFSDDKKRSDEDIVKSLMLNIRSLLSK